MSTDEQSIQFYSKGAEKYAAHVRNPKESVYHSYYEKPAMYALLPDLKGKTVLSIGCGSGEDSIHLKRQNAGLSIGIDMSRELISIAKKAYPECEFMVMNMENIDFKANSFDFAYSSLAIHYVEDWEGVFKQVYRILKPNSNFLFSCGHPVGFALNQDENASDPTTILAMRNDNATDELIWKGEYFAKKKIFDALGKNTANTWTMSISEISMAIANAGFLIEQIVEPRPLNELRAIDPKTYYRLSKIPDFLIFKLKKL